MLLEFTLENDRAFAQESSLSMVATKLKETIEGSTVDVGDAAGTAALTSALVLGKNGSGKSTLVTAMRFVSGFVRNSSSESQVGEKISYTPNRLVDGYRTARTRYRVVFSMNGAVYDFEFEHDADRVVSERLSVADKSVRFRRMYDRKFVPETASYEFSFGEALTGRRTAWQELTRDNALFLSTAAQLNSADVQPAYEWLTDYLRAVDMGSPYFRNITARMCTEDEKRRKQIVSFLQALDINIEDIEIEEERLDDAVLSATFSSQFIDMVRQNVDEKTFSTMLKVRFVKRRSDGSFEKFPISRESTGTQVLFGLAGPLFDALEHGHCLIVDEINTNLHPLIVRALIDLFADRRQNCRRAQLVFTSHDTSVLTQQRVRRDQVWIVDSDGLGARLVPLSDYSPRRGEALDRGYLGGRYGGVPVVAPALLKVPAGCE